MESLLLDVQYLDLSSSEIERENLVIILEGCKQLFHLDVRDCKGFDEGDEEILKLASHNATFKDEGSSLEMLRFLESIRDVNFVMEQVRMHALYGLELVQ
ncbi:hypothetical protein RHGRI_011791 [Rhododendron griersonianum]|uniref:RNI-like superfamily protein n=1 Tax=Rhododendron griersonianum TaxID=479676 RepID=A0AAV6KPE3_9ERIC|nr:hypothetical protein RHGRI_011791 [Rhododendron griersonianum]